MELSPPPSPAGLSGSRGATVEEDAATAESVVVVVAGAGDEVAGAAGAGEEADPDLASQGLGLGGSDDMKSAGARSGVGSRRVKSGECALYGLCVA